MNRILARLRHLAVDIPTMHRVLLQCCMADVKVYFSSKSNKLHSCLRFDIELMVSDESLLLMSKTRNLNTSRISSWNVNPSTSKMPENSRGKRWRATRLCRLLSAAKVGLNFSIFAALLMVISASTTISAIHSCNRGRFVVNSTWGAITNGPENYREDSYCVWLIEGICCCFSKHLMF